MRVFFFLTLATGIANSFQPSAIHRNNAFLSKIQRGGSLSTTSSQGRSSPFGPFRATASDPPSEPWTEPRLHNKPLVRSAAILVALAAAGLSAPFGKVGSRFLASLHLLSFGTWFGTVFYTTFIAGITMFKALPRQTFGKVQSKLFPKYFSLCSISIVLQLITLGRLSSAIPVGSSRALGISLVMTLLNQFVLEPKSTKIMFDRYELENSNPNAMETDEYKDLKSSFGKLHGMSSLTNLIALIGAAVHGAYLSTTLVG